MPNHHHQHSITPQFAPVVPIDVAQLMRFGDQGDILGDYHLLLAHDVVKHSFDYRKVYAASRIERQTIIMDNSVIELGYPIEKEVMVEALTVVSHMNNRLVFVLPDRLLDKGGTLLEVEYAMKKWAPYILKSLPMAEMMCVPQGSNIAEWVECIEALAAYKEIKWVGIPRNFREKLGGSRIQAAQIASILRPDWIIHLLGFSDDLHDDIVSCHLGTRMGYKIAGIDSAVPIRMALREGEPICFSNQVHSPRGDWWDRSGSGDWETRGTGRLVADNVSNIRQWIS